MKISKIMFSLGILAMLCVAAITSTVSAEWTEDEEPLFTLWLGTASDSLVQIPAATIYQQDLAKIGINLEIYTIDPATISSILWGDNWNKTYAEGVGIWLCGL